MRKCAFELLWHVRAWELIDGRWMAQARMKEDVQVPKHVGTYTVVVLQQPAPIEVVGASEKQVNALLAASILMHLQAGVRT